MGSANHGLGAAGLSYGSGNALTSSAGRNMAKNSDFMKAFGNGPTNSRTIEPQQTDKSALVFNSNEPSFFDFDRVSNTNSPFQNRNPFGTPGGGLPGWGSEVSFRPLSPPDSASSFSKEWNFGYQNGSNPPVPSIFTDNGGNTNARAQYGQVTPPDDEHDEESLLDHHLRQRQEDTNDTAPTKKRKRGNRNNSKTVNQTPSKRSRKNSSREPGASTDHADPSRPEDVRRSKFLERNRVAASKCRQKKKEWTQNLEDRSRQLQKDNNSMHMMIDSLRQEVLFLKGEMLRHGECDNSHIQDYLKSCASELSGNSMGLTTKRESSPLEDISRSQGTVDLDGQSTIDEERAPREQTNAEIAEDENALEVLLASSINCDVNEKDAVKSTG